MAAVIVGFAVFALPGQSHAAEGSDEEMSPATESDAQQEIKEQTELEKALAELAKQKKARLDAEAALAAATNPQEAELSEQLAKYSSYQKELTALKGLLPGQDSKWTAASLSLGKGVHVDNEYDGSGIAAVIAEEFVAKSGLSAGAKAVLVSPSWLAVAQQHFGLMTRLQALSESFEAIEEAADEIKPGDAGQVKSLSGFATIGAALGGVDALLKGAAAIAGAFQVSREIQDPLALTSFASMLESEIASKLISKQVDLTLPHLELLASVAGVSDLETRLKAMRTARAKASAGLEKANERVSEAKKSAEKLTGEAGGEDAAKKAAAQASLPELEVRLERAERALSSQNELFKVLEKQSQEIESSLTAGSSSGPPALEVLRLWERAKKPGAQLLIVKVEAAGARNEIRKSVFRSPRWVTATGAVVSGALVSDTGKVAKVWTSRSLSTSTH